MVHFHSGGLRGRTSLRKPRWLYSCALALAAVAVGMADDRAATLCGGAGGLAERARVPFDKLTGADPRSYPPDPQVDYLHIKLELDFADPMSRSFTCVETITFQTLAARLERLELNAVELKIASVADLDGKPLSYRYDDEKLTVRFEPALAAKTDAGLVIHYECRAPKTGMIFALPDASYPDRALTIHTQGQAEDNRYWMVCHDYPNERCTTETITTVPARYKVLSNGRLIETKDLGDGRVRYHYRLDVPHVTYLISLVLGELEVVAQDWRGIPVEYWVPPAGKEHALRTFGQTPAMIEVFSRQFGLAYPYPKYAQASVYLFQWGGMENTSCTTLYEECWLDEEAAREDDLEDLIAHELGHQWFGDALTCKSWAHIWLNEGFATYCEYVWYEAAYGAERYDAATWSLLHGVAQAEQPDQVGGMVSRHYGDPWDQFGRGASDPYSKGASVLHMLRRTLGDELFWACLRDYVTSNAWKCVESDDLRKTIESLSGRNFEQFFEQWVYRGGAPHVRVDYAWDDANRNVQLRFEQTQAIDQAYPAFAFDLPVWLVLEGGQVEKHVVPIKERFASLNAAVAAEPTIVAIDPQAAVIAQYELNLPAPMLVRQARSGPTMAARMQALDALTRLDRDDARQTAAATLLDPNLLRELRIAAAETLGRMHNESARDALLAAVRDAALSDPRVRRAAVAALGGYRNESVAAALLDRAAHDPAKSVVAAACDGLGRQAPSDAIVERLLACTKVKSREDRVQRAAVRALASLAEPRGLPPALELARYGAPYRSRPDGVRALGRLGRDAESVRDAARDFLVSLLNDPQDKTAEAAPGALGTLGDDEAVGPLEALAGGAAREELRRLARDAIDAIHRQSGESDVVRDLRARIATLEAFREKAEKHAQPESGEGNVATQP